MCIACTFNALLLVLPTYITSVTENQNLCEHDLSNLFFQLSQAMSLWKGTQQRTMGALICG